MKVARHEMPGKRTDMIRSVGNGMISGVWVCSPPITMQCPRRRIIPYPTGRRSWRYRLHAAFSLVEVLASLFILTVSAVGITTAWRLADYQELLTRVDRRAERVLRQYYELQTFAPADSRPFPVNDSLSSSTRGAITGHLYYPRLPADQSGSPKFGQTIPFSITMTTGTTPGTNQLVLTYTIPSYGPQSARQITKTVILNP